MSWLPDDFFSERRKLEMQTPLPGETANEQLHAFIRDADGGGSSLQSLFDAGERVDEITAMGVAALYGGVKIITDAISGLDFEVQWDDGAPVKMAPAWAKPVPIPEINMDRWVLLYRISHAITMASFSAAPIHMYHPRTGLPHMIEPLPSRFTHMSGHVGTQARVVYSPSGHRGSEAKTYLEWGGPGDQGEDRCMVWRPSDDGTLEGASLITRAGAVIARALAVARHAKLYFEYPSARAFINLGPVQDDRRKEFAEELTAAQRRPENRHQTVVLNTKEDVKFQKMGDTAKDANLVQVMDLMVREICRLVGIAPQMLGENNTTWGTGSHEAKLSLYDFAIHPKVEFIAKAFGMMLPPNQKVAFDTTRMSRPAPVSPTDRATVVKTLAESGKFTDNEIRAIWDPKLPAMPGGDTLPEPPAPVMMPAEAAPEGQPDDKDEESDEDA